MAAIFGVGCVGIVMILSILLICGVPIGELTMGGQHKVYPGKLRLISVTQLILQAFFAIIILQAGGYVPLWFSYKTTKIIGIVIAVYLTLNIFTNFISPSKKEKYIMTPLSLLTAICVWITMLQM